MSNVQLQWITPKAEWNIAYVARGSNPPNQSNPEFEKLFRYCLLHKPVPHISPFQMASMCLEFETSLAIAGQVIRHWSMSVCEPMDIQQTSMRYLDPFEYELGFQPVELRKAAKKNRQSSEEALEGEEYVRANDALERLNAVILSTRDTLKELGVANETLRMIYPQSTTTRFFISGSCRSWIHYFQQRLDKDAQKEHQELAGQAFLIFERYFPTVSKIMFPKEE